MASETNTTCSICGKPYYVCRVCREQISFKPWRTVVDELEHYKIYLAIHGYSVTKNKESAKQDLSSCDLSEKDTFLPHIQKVIDEILADDKKDKTYETEVSNASDKGVKSAYTKKYATKNKVKTSKVGE